MTPATPAPERVAVVVSPHAADRGAVVGTGVTIVGSLAEVASAVAALEAQRAPRWTWWAASHDAAALVAAGLRLRRCWDVAEVHRVAHGGWEAGPQTAWAAAKGLDPRGMPRPDTGHLFDLGDPAPAGGLRTDQPGSTDAVRPVRPDGYLEPDAGTPLWRMDDDRLLAWGHAALECAAAQQDRLEAVAGTRAVATAHSESAAALLCVELEHDGLPVDRAAAETLIARAAGARPTDESQARATRAERDALVLRHAPGREHTDLRNPLQVRELLAGVGVVVPNTRKWVLEPFRETHPLVAALLDWRRDERIATTYGYAWLDTHVGSDDRLRGGWTACDGAAGRMTAQNGLHNLPAVLRPAVAAHEGHVLVRADLGQIEPRVLAAVSGDRAFAAATRADDLYAPVAAALGVERPVAKVAVLAAMYGQRSGPAGEALRGLERAYPTAMAYLERAYAAGVRREPLRTYGGRLIRLGAVPEESPGPPEADGARAALGRAALGRPGAGATEGFRGDPSPEDRTAVDRSRDAARGRFARNAVVQGAAAELFKAWAATVRATTDDLGAQIVLCLHDELLVHVPQEAADEAVRRVGLALDDSARRWTGSTEVRFVADTSVVRRWSDAKA